MGIGSERAQGYDFPVFQRPYISVPWGAASSTRFTCIMQVELAATHGMLITSLRNAKLKGAEPLMSRSALLEISFLAIAQCAIQCFFLDIAWK